MKVEIKVVKEKGYPLVLPITKKEKKFEKEFFEDIQFRRVFEKGKEIIYGSFKKNEDLKFGARLIKFLKIEKVKKVWIDCSKLNSRFLVEGILLASYEFNKYKKKKKEEKIEVFLVNGKKEEVKLAKLISEAVYFARDLENEPANKLYPAKFVEIAKKKLKGMKKIKIKVFDEKELEKKGFGGIIAVGKGSSNKPRFLVIEYKGNGKERSIALVGKGVCFDAGGIHLKPSGYIEDMKMDMSGAAVVLSLIWLASKTNLKINLVGAIPLVENVPSANATKPGDIIKMYDGQTVEVVNTDAEGRLILADA
ncbi:MAG: leucyl aminopeptidase, partial [Candidatus Aenigmarchaeota archaeon ex4484_224]